MKCLRAVLLGAIGVFTSMAIAARDGHAESASKGDPERGKYIFRVAGICGCHGFNLGGYRTGNATTMPKSAPFGERFDGPFGSVPASNISPDKKTGIGKWTDDQIIAATRGGVRADKSPLFPIMPFVSYSGMADQDVHDLVAYLRTVPPVANKVEAKKLNPPPPGAQPPAMPPLMTAPKAAPTSPPEKRGEYLVRSVGDCGGCHTTMAPDGQVMADHFLAGNVFPMGDGFMVIPNITLGSEGGVASWTADDFAKYLKSGKRPNGTDAFGPMAMLVNEAYRFLTDEDAMAIGAYLKTIPAVKYVPQPPPQQKQANQ